MRAQRVAFLLCFSAKKSDGIYAASCIPLVASDHTSSSLVQSQRCTDVHLDLCQFGHNIRRPTRVLLANVDPCDAEKLRRSCHGFEFACSRSEKSSRQTRNVIPSQLPIEFCHALVRDTAHRKTSDGIPRRLPAECCHSLVQTLMAEPHARFSYSLHTVLPAHENIASMMVWGAGASLF